MVFQDSAPIDFEVSTPYKRAHNKPRTLRYKMVMTDHRFPYTELVYHRAVF
jgi:hypothetical protein